MKARSSMALAAWSALALLPATVFLVAGLVFFVGAVVAIVDGKFFLPDGAPDYEFLYLSLSYLVGVFALGNFWGLAIATARQRQVSIAWRMWLAIACAFIAAVGAGMVGGARALIFVVLPVSILVVWLLRLQYQGQQRS